MLVEPRHHRHFVIRRGQVLREIAEEYGGVMVSFPRSGTQSDRVTLKGAKDCVEAAKKRIQEIIEDLVGARELGVLLGHGGGGRPCVPSGIGPCSPGAFLSPAASSSSLRSLRAPSVSGGTAFPLSPPPLGGDVSHAAASEALSLAKPDGSLWSQSRSPPRVPPRGLMCPPLTPPAL